MTPSVRSRLDHKAKIKKAPTGFRVDYRLVLYKIGTAVYKEWAYAVCLLLEDDKL